MRWLAILALLTGCQAGIGPNEGIAVGNPGLTSMSLAVSDGMVVTAATGTVSSAQFAGEACGGADAAAALGLEVDLAQEPASFEFPAGVWCGVEVRFEGGLRVEADWTGPNGEAATVVADLGLVDVSLRSSQASLDVDEETELAMELGAPDWLDATALGLEDGDALEIDAEDPLHVALLSALTTDSRMYDDADGNGLVEDDERQLGALAVAGELAFYANAVGMDSSEQSCSVADGGGGLGWLLLLLAGLARPWLRSRERR
jgi:hypothetical protein